MKKLTAKLVFESERQRFYKLDHKITKGTSYGSEVDIISEMDRVRKNMVKPEYEEMIPTDGCDIVCLSDAHTHTERLAFCGGMVVENGKEIYGRLSIQIDGITTMIIHGGDHKSVKPDRVYLRRLAKLNGFQFIQ